MARERLVVAIDVGTTKVCTLISRVTEDEELEVLGVGVTRSDALRKGVVTSVEQAGQDIQSSVQKAEQQSGFKIISAYVGISGSHLQTDDAHGVVTVRRADRAISEDDVNRVLEAARPTSLPPDRELIELVPRHFTVDGQEEIASPVGMLGHRLEVEATMITGLKSAIQNLTNCVERAGVSIDALIPLPVAAGEAVLTPAERDLGVTLIDLGGGTTDIGVFAEGGLMYATVLPVGGQQLTNDLAVRLRTPFSAAEEIKLRHGQAYPNGPDDDRMIDVSSFDSDESSPVSVRTLCDTLEDRLVETFELVRKRLERAGFESSLPAGAVLVGGTAQLPNIRRLAADILESPVRIGVPSGIIGIGEQLNNPAFASSVGLLRWGLHHIDDGGSPPGAAALSGAWDSVRRWLGSFLP
jgi:cell division protein FtsA